MQNNCRKKIKSHTWKITSQDKQMTYPLTKGWYSLYVGVPPPTPTLLIGLGMTSLIIL